MKYVWIINPCAGDRNDEEQIRDAVSKLPQKNDSEVYVTTAPGDATRFVRQWCASRPEESVRFIACGGDGTLNEVINGAVGHENVSVTCYPCGSGDDFIKTFGGAARFRDFGGLVTAPTRTIDLLSVHDLTGEYRDRYSMNVVNFGFDTTVARTVNDQRMKTGHTSGSTYIKGVIMALITSMRNKCTVKADGEVLDPSGTLMLCTLANGQYVGGSFHCAPRSKPDDGLIDVCIIKPISRLRVPEILKPYAAGTFLDDPKMRDILTYRRVHEVEVSAPDGFAFSLDGEILQTSRFTVSIAPKALSFAVPQ